MTYPIRNRQQDIEVERKGRRGVAAWAGWR